MKRMRRWSLLTAFAGGSLFAGCTTDLRDALLAGILDYITDTTTNLVTAVSPLDDLAGAE